jgi:hypothetical protein
MVAQSSAESFATADVTFDRKLWEFRLNELLLQRLMVAFPVVVQHGFSNRSLQR